MELVLRGWLLCLGVFLCLETQGAPALLTPCRVEAILHDLRDQSFEKHLFHSPQSLAVRYPEAYQRVLALFQESPGWEALFAQGLSAGVSYQLVIDAILNERIRLATAIRTVARESAPAARDLRRFLESAARSFEVPSLTSKRWADRVHRARIEELKQDTKGEKFLSLERGYRHNDQFLSFAYEMRTTWGEIRSGFLMPNLLAHNIVTEELGAFTPLFPKLDQGEGGKSFLQTNLDLVWATGNVLHFGEVKSYFVPLQYSEEPGSHWSHLVDQLERIRWVAGHSNADWNIHVILLNGIGARASERLTQMGYRVQGPPR